MPFIKAEYIWLDGTKPTAQLRSKTKVVEMSTKEWMGFKWREYEPPIWGFDGSSTNQAPGENSDCVLTPVFVCPDPIRGNDGINILVLCEVSNTDGTPHLSNTRDSCESIHKGYKDQHMLFGLEQEYTFFRDSSIFFSKIFFNGNGGTIYVGKPYLHHTNEFVWYIRNKSLFSKSYGYLQS